MMDEVERLHRKVQDLERRILNLQETEKALWESEEKYRLIADHSGDCIWIMDLASLRFTYVSPSVRHLYGATVDEVLMKSAEEVMPPESLAVAMRALEEELAAEASGAANPDRSRKIEIQEYRKDRSLVWVENVLSFLRDKTGKPVSILGVSRDISDRKRLEEDLRRLAVTDPLTGAYNRRFLMEELRHEIYRSNRYGTPFSLIMLDLDHFKEINDRLGHETGDRILTALVTMIRKRTREGDLLARWGGEEFLILTANTPLPRAVKLAENLLERMQSAPLADCGIVTASFGVTSFHRGESADALLTRADNLMYRAKREGRARVVHDGSTST